MNRNGQALVEALLAGAICCGAFLLLLRCGLNLLFSVWSDEVLEDHLLCRAAAGSHCRAVLNSRLSAAGCRYVRLTESRLGPRLTDRLELTTPYLKITLEKELDTEAFP